MSQRTVVVGVAASLVAFALAFPPLARSAPPEQRLAAKTVTGPTVGPVIRPGVMVKDLRTLPPAPAGERAKQGLPVRVPDWFPRPQGVSLTTPVTAGGTVPAIGVHALAPTGVLNFDGNTGGGPPDVNGAVGQRYYVQTTNLTLGIYDKGTGAPAYVNSLANFFAAGNTGTSCDTEQRSDPVALYDTAADRFIITDLSRADENIGPWYQCIAVARTSDPIAGGWNFYAVGSGPAGAGELTNRWLNDYPKTGVWPDGYYMMADMYDTVACPGGPGCNPGDTWHSFFTTVRVWALDRAAMLAGNPMTPISFDVPNVYSMVPTNLTGASAAPPAGRVNYFGVTDYPDPSKGQTSTTIHIYKFHSDFAVPASSTFTGPFDVTVPVYTSPSTAPPEPGTNIVLDTLGTRLMYQLQYRNIGGTESLWGLHTVNDANNFCVTRWYQFNVTGDPSPPTLVQSGTTANGDSTHRWMGHLATDQFGNMAIEYSDSSSSVNPGVRYNGRLFSDALGSLQSEATLFNGPGVFGACTPTPPATTCVGRWGDYSSMEVDPVDDCTFWFTNEYVSGGGGSASRVGSARFGGCTCNVQITKTHSPAPVLANGVLTYDLFLHNGGPVGAYAVTVTDNLANPFVSITPPPGWVCTTPAVGSGGLVTCTGVLPYPGATDIFISVTAPNAITIVANTGNVSTASTNTAPIGTTTSDDLAQVISPSDVTGTKTVLTSAGLLYPTFPVQFQVVLTNNSNNDQFDNPGDEFTDTLPATLTLNSASATSGTATTGGNTVHWNGAIPAHTSVTITINATINPSTAPGTIVTNTGTIFYDVTGTGINSGQHTASGSFLVIAPIPTLTIIGLLALLAILVGSGVFYLRRVR